jgi:hypothetical protein
MSLLARVSSLEALSPERGRSPDARPSSRDRKLSFSPLPGPWKQPAVPEDGEDEEEQEAETVAAFDVPKTKRISKQCHYQRAFSFSQLANTILTCSTSYHGSDILSLCCWNSIRLRGHKARPHTRESLPQPLYTRRARQKRTNMLRARITIESDVHNCSSRDKCGSTANRSNTR